MPRVLTDAEIDDFRDRLCEAATRLFAERGIEGFTMRQLATELGVSPMTPYRYFKDKEAILMAVRIRAFNRFSEALEAGFASRKAPIDRANGAGQAYIRFAMDNPAAYRLMFDMAPDVEQASAELDVATDRARAAMTRHIVPLVDAGILAGNVQLMGHVFWAVLHGAIMLALAGKLTEEFDLQTLVDNTFAALAAGFAPAGATG